MFNTGVKPLTVFPQYFPEYLLNVRNHSQKPLLVGGWLGKGMRETLPGCHFLFPRPPAPPGHLASVSPSDGAHHWSRRLGELWEMLGAGSRSLGLLCHNSNQK